MTINKTFHKICHKYYTTRTSEQLMKHFNINITITNCVAKTNLSKDMIIVEQLLFYPNIFRSKHIFNQIDLYLCKSKHVHFKILKNGSIHITGCKSLLDCNSKLVNLYEVLKQYKVITTENHFIYENEIVMTNCCFRLLYINNIDHDNIYLDGTIGMEYEMFTILSVRHCTPYLQITIANKKNSKRTNISIFRTGKILCSGLYTNDELIVIFKFMNYLFWFVTDHKK